NTPTSRAYDPASSQLKDWSTVSGARRDEPAIAVLVFSRRAPAVSLPALRAVERRIAGSVVGVPVSGRTGAGVAGPMGCLAGGLYGLCNLYRSGGFFSAGSENSQTTNYDGLCH